MNTLKFPWPGKAVVTLFSLYCMLATLLLSPLAHAQVDANAWYVLINRHSGMAMDIDARSTQAGAPLIQWTRNNANNQQFRFVSSGGGYYRMVARHSGLALDIYDWNADDGAEVVQWEDLNAHNQQFRIDDMGAGITVSSIASVARPWITGVGQLKPVRGSPSLRLPLRLFSNGKWCRLAVAIRLPVVRAALMQR